MLFDFFAEPQFYSCVISAVVVACAGAYKAYRCLQEDIKEDKLKQTKYIPMQQIGNVWTNVTFSQPTKYYYFTGNGNTSMTKSPFSNIEQTYPKDQSNDPHGGKAYDESIKPKSPFSESALKDTIIQTGMPDVVVPTRTSPLASASSSVVKYTPEYEEMEAARQSAILNKNGGIAHASPLSRSKAVIIPGVDITKQDIEMLGTDVSRKVGVTTKNIISKMTVDRFGELGSTLALVNLEAENLDPNSFFKGIMGFFRKQVTNVRAVLVERLETASSVFDQLKSKLTTQIALQEEWIKDLDSIYAENIAHEKEISTTLKQAYSWKRLVQAAYAAFPDIDPNDEDAMLRVQEKRELEVILNRISMKIDTFEKLKVLAQSNAPKIISQQNTCENIIMTLRDTIDQTIPMIERAFAEYLADLDVQKAGAVVSATRNLGDATLRKSADSSHQSAVQSATLLNESMIKTDTLKYIREKMIATVTDVRKIESDANVRREQDSIELKKTQDSYLLEMSKHVSPSPNQLSAIRNH